MQLHVSFSVSCEPIKCILSTCYNGYRCRPQNKNDQGSYHVLTNLSYNHVTCCFFQSQIMPILLGHGRRTEDSITRGYTGRPSERHSRTETLPDFVLRLQQKGILDPREQAVERVQYLHSGQIQRWGEGVVYW